MTTTDPLPPFLALPDGEPEPVSEEALTWLEHRIAEMREATLAEVLADAAAGAEEAHRGPSYGDIALFRHAESMAALARFEVTDDQKAQWAMAKLAEVERQGEEVAEQAEAWTATVERWRQERLRPLEARTAYFTRLLTEYLRGLREADPRVKSKVLPSGEILSRSHGAKVVVTDEDKLVAWARESGHDEVLRTKVTVLLSELKRVATLDDEAGVARDPENGFPIPGAVVAPSGVSYSVKVN